MLAAGGSRICSPAAHAEHDVRLEPKCALPVIDLRTGTIAHWLRFDGSLVTELYDVVVLPGVRQPMALGFKTNEIERLLLVDEPGAL
jgi:hypothetical protein